MDTQALKISLAQKILSLTDARLLEKLKNLIEKENIVGYEADGTPITESKYMEEIDKLMRDIDSGKEKLYSTDEVLKIIVDENSLDE